MGILGVIGVVIGIAILGLAAFGALMIFARGMSDVPLGDKEIVKQIKDINKN